jgi:hypothetical protein
MSHSNRKEIEAIVETISDYYRYGETGHVMKTPIEQLKIMKIS